MMRLIENDLSFRVLLERLSILCLFEFIVSLIDLVWNLLIFFIIKDILF